MTIPFNWKCRKFQPAFIAVVLFCLAHNTIAQRVVSADEVRQAGLRVVEITTVDGEEPRGETVSHPDDPTNQNVVAANKPACRIVITLAGDTLYDSLPYQRDSTGATIRIAGNTSAYFSNPQNMPYKLKLERKADLLCRGEAYRDRHWRLMKDTKTLRTILALKLSEILGLEWTPAYRPCNVVINGDYRGCYLLMESVRRNPRCRIRCDKATGYIVERDPYWWKEDSCFSSDWYDGSSRFRWTWKYPEEQEVTIGRRDSIQRHICAAEQSIADGNYDHYFDLTSLAKWLILHDLLATRDADGTNFYLKKTDDSDTTLLQMPCVWDFDSSFELPEGSFSTLHTIDNTYFSAMLASGNQAFARTYATVWHACKDTLLNQLTAFLTDYPSTAEAQVLNRSRKLNDQRWGWYHPTVAQDAQKLLKRMRSHIALLDDQIPFPDDAVTTVRSATERPAPPQQLFTIAGTAVCREQARKGLYILQGRVILLP